MASYHRIEDNVSTYFLGLELVDSTNMECLDDSSCDRCSKHNQVSLKYAIESVIACKEVCPVLFFLAELDTGFTNSEVGDEDEEESCEESDVEANDLQENPASSKTDFRSRTSVRIVVKEKHVLRLEDGPNLPKDAEESPRFVSKFHSETPLRFGSCELLRQELDDESCRIYSVREAKQHNGVTVVYLVTNHFLRNVERRNEEPEMKYGVAGRNLEARHLVEDFHNRRILCFIVIKPKRFRFCH